MFFFLNTYRKQSNVDNEFTIVMFNKCGLFFLTRKFKEFGEFELRSTRIHWLLLSVTSVRTSDGWCPKHPVVFWKIYCDRNQHVQCEFGKIQPKKVRS